MRGVDGYYDIVWADVNIEKINTELLEFQNKWAFLSTSCVCWI